MIFDRFLSLKYSLNKLSPADNREFLNAKYAVFGFVICSRIRHGRNLEVAAEFRVVRNGGVARSAPKWVLHENSAPTPVDPDRPRTPNPEEFVFS